MYRRCKRILKLGTVLLLSGSMLIVIFFGTTEKRTAITPSMKPDDIVYNKVADASNGGF